MTTSAIERPTRRESPKPAWTTFASDVLSETMLLAKYFLLADRTLAKIVQLVRQFFARQSGPRCLFERIDATQPSLPCHTGANRVGPRERIPRGIPDVSMLSATTKQRGRSALDDRGRTGMKLQAGLGTLRGARQIEQALAMLCRALSDR